MEKAQSKLSLCIISDSVGSTATAVVNAAVAQFEGIEYSLDKLWKVTSFSEVEDFLAPQLIKLQEDSQAQLVIFYTLVDSTLRMRMKGYMYGRKNVQLVDILTPSIEALKAASGVKPAMNPGLLHKANAAYFDRIDAVEFTIAHDGGKRPEDLTRADIVLMGVSRTSKTPLSVYLSQQGYKVANLLVEPGKPLPEELSHVLKERLFGLMTTVEVLETVRSERFDEIDTEALRAELAESQILMEELGAIIIHTENRAVEEISGEILSHLGVLE